MSEQIYELTQEQHYQAESQPNGIMEIAYKWATGPIAA